MTKILFVDIDGTPSETISGHSFKQHPQDVKVMEGADKALAHFHNSGWTVIGISNQGGIAKGFKSRQATIQEMQFTMQLLPELIAVYFCPDFEGQECWRVLQLSASEVGAERLELIGQYRKPEAGMIKFNFRAYYPNVIKDAWMVGDRLEDEQCAINAGINFCPAQVWRDRFRAGIFTHQVTPEQLRFLEGIELGK